MADQGPRRVKPGTARESYLNTLPQFTKKKKKMLRASGAKETVRKKEISSVVIKMKNGSPAALNKS